MVETGLNQNWNRDYDSLTGRYSESDPIGLPGGIGTYTYAGASPVLGIDPAGQNPIALATIDGLVTVAGAAIACSSTSICSDAVKAATNAISQAGSQCPKDKCAELQKEIDELVGELKSRYLAATVDQYDLFIANIIGRISWTGHQWWYENRVQPKLVAKIAEAKALGCPYNPEADKMVSKPFPNSPVRWMSGPRE
jgi:hypothetical protein